MVPDLSLARRVIEDAASAFKQRASTRRVPKTINREDQYGLDALERNVMKRLYVCGSFKFTHEMEELERKLKEENFQFQMSKKIDSRGILGCLKKVDDADIVYVVNPQGYIGKSVSVDIGYAYAKNKSIYVMHPVDDPPIMDLINDVLSPKALVDFLKESSPKRH